MTPSVPTRLALSLYVLWALLLCAPATGAHAVEIIRILVAEAQAEVLASGVDLQIQSQGQTLLAIDGVGGLRLRPSAAGIVVERVEGSNAESAWDAALSVSSPSGIVAVGKRSYKGTLEIDADEGGLRVVNHLPLEDYLPGVVASEVPASWPAEALRAQAVAARSYAVARKARTVDQPFDLHGSILDQVYRGASDVPWQIHEAVRSTRGQVLVRGGAVVEAFYHSNCGGLTESAEAVWEGRGAYPPVVACSTCAGAPGYQWRVDIPTREAAKKLAELGFGDDNVVSIIGIAQTSSGRYTELRVAGPTSAISIPGNELRRALGFSRVRSLRFEVEVSGGMIRFQGTGYGHGVGMCQWGAKGRASAGVSHARILGHYYPGSHIEVR